MSSAVSNQTPKAGGSPCPFCEKPYRTLVKRNYGLREDGGIKQSVPMGSQWRCMSCGKTFSTDNE